MRYGFGLVGLLVVVAIIFTLWTLNTKEVVDKSKPAREQAQRWAGQDENGMPAMDSVSLEAFPPDGNMRGLRVTAVVPGGAMEKMYGLQKNDLIIGADSHGLMNKLSEGSFNEGKAWILTSYQEKRPLQVIRANEKITLPLENAPVPSVAQPSVEQNSPEASPAQPQPTAPQKAPKDTRSALQRQLDEVTKPR